MTSTLSRGSHNIDFPMDPQIGKFASHLSRPFTPPSKKAVTGLYFTRHSLCLKSILTVTLAITS